MRCPSELAITKGCPPSMTATQEFVVPKSIPTTFAISSPWASVEIYFFSKHSGISRYLVYLVSRSQSQTGNAITEALPLL
ncbi:hypothetical protein DSM107003_31440 [Trichormus variabilis SAG 1403-4b]|uniref:Uncharacterized protein n=1 Tax=Trichormus variabilis SAG 1403-4b TaxID=447716 RepID=A0A433UNN7_ANAVA|nr:hypothetical protein DSM107003_31440 [Trichormus variabilis SAG 1403-4b]